MGGGGTLISVYPEELTFLCKFCGVLGIFLIHIAIGSTSAVSLRAVELEKPCYCNLKVVNNSEHHVAFKVRDFPISPQNFRVLCDEKLNQVCPIFLQVKTTSPRKYFVRPNASIVQPWDSCTITSEHLFLLFSMVLFRIPCLVFDE